MAVGGGPSQGFPVKKGGGRNKHDSLKANRGDAGALIALTGAQRWYELPQASGERLAEPCKDATVAGLREEAGELLRADVQLARRASGGHAWLDTLTRRGTRPDRHAAAVVRLQERPVHDGLDVLRRMVDGMRAEGEGNGKGGARREAFAALDTLKDAFITYLLPPDRKLIPFDQRPLDKLNSLTNKDRCRTLILWYFEDQLKSVYADFVAAVEHLSHDTIEANRLKCVHALCDLLAEHPEAEHRLLPAVVNKLGDASGKLAGSVCNAMGRVLLKHPNMRPVFVDKLEELVYRPNVRRSAQFYACHFLSQMMLRVGEAELALKMLAIYLDLFKVLVDRNEAESKLVGILLAGAARAYPFAKNHPSASERLEKQLDSLYKVAATSGSLSTAVHTLQLLYRMQEDAPTDRFYMSVYRTLNDDRLESCSKTAGLLSLLCKAVKSDPVQARACAFVKRALACAARCQSGAAAALIRLVHEWVLDRPQLLNLTQAKHYSSAASEAPFKTEPDVELADVKPSISATVGTLPKTIPVAGSEESDEERYEDVLDEDDRKVDVKDVAQKSLDAQKKAHWVHRDNLGGGNKKAVSQSLEYDPAQRNPLFAGGDKTPVYELLALCQHYHPSVRLYAANLLHCRRAQMRRPEDSGDPLVDFGTMRFLDRFVYRNPRVAGARKKRRKKNDDGPPEETDQQPAATVAKIMSRKQKLSNRAGVRSLPVTSADYLLRPAGDIPADERFLHRFLTSAGRPGNVAARKGGGGEASDDDSVNSDEFDAILDQMEPGAANDKFDLDFAGALDKGVRASAVLGRRAKRKRRRLSADSDASDDDDEDGDEADADEAGGAADDEVPELEDMMGTNKKRKAKYEKYLQKQEGGGKDWRQKKRPFKKGKFGGKPKFRGKRK